MIPEAEPFAQDPRCKKAAEPQQRHAANQSAAEGAVAGAELRRGCGCGCSGAGAEVRLRVRLRLRARVAPVQVQTRGVVRVVGGAGGCSLLSLLLRLCLGMGSVVAHAREGAAPALHACNAHVPPPAPRVLCEMPGHRAWDGNEGTVRAGTDEGLVLACPLPTFFDIFMRYLPAFPGGECRNIC